MKKVIQGKELWEVMDKTVNLLCDAVSSTLGPTGNNVLINHWELAPYITKDGVTIASSIESDNQIENTILEIVKEASLKTNEKVGDGTTTTLVLLQSIFNESLKIIKEGYNSILLKKELEEALEEILKKLEKEKQKPKPKHLLQIAKTSSNDEKIAFCFILSSLSTQFSSNTTIYSLLPLLSTNFLVSALAFHTNQTNKIR